MISAIARPSSVAPAPGRPRSTVTEAGRCPLAWLAATPPADLVDRVGDDPDLTPAPVVPSARPAARGAPRRPGTARCRRRCRRRHPGPHAPSDGLGARLQRGRVEQLVGGQPAGHQPLGARSLDAVTRMPSPRRAAAAAATSPSTYTSTSTAPSSTRAPLSTVGTRRRASSPVCSVTGSPLAAASARICSPASSLATSGRGDSEEPAAGAGCRPNATRIRRSQGNGQEATSLHRATVSTRTTRAPWLTRLRACL